MLLFSLLLSLYDDDDVAILSLSISLHTDNSSIYAFHGVFANFIPNGYLTRRKTTKQTVEVTLTFNTDY